MRELQGQVTVTEELRFASGAVTIAITGHGAMRDTLRRVPDEGGCGGRVSAGTQAVEHFRQRGARSTRSFWIPSRRA